ncbi:PKD domain-containing protein [Pedobacter africanus]|uniref:Gliding motility-associated C-terminal domain-containing protein n=1 Tax=Pedobacter africanus TaxID=151894 RepID=A0A1W2E0W0_9SPHI|nr:PKD domain-containing protein [Pedobacter africanus]SMD03383.1 gliding motility-associated C-terminal domain-containing protein [Pedobacter africanus]
MCYRWGLMLWMLSCFLCFAAEAQNISNEGKAFWAVFPSHDPSRNGNTGIPALANVRIYITAKVASEVTVSCGTFNPAPVPVPANTVVWVDVPRSAAYIDEITDVNRSVPGKGIHVQVTPGHEKVAVFEHIYAGARSAASLILPIEALGREYYSMNYTQDQSNRETSKNFLVLVAANPDTRLIVHKKDGSTFPVLLTNAGDVYEYMPADREDLTGVYVEIDPASPDNCNKRFAAYSGSTSLIIGCNGSRDPLFQQLYPPGSWGKNYGVAPFKDRRYVLRVLAQQDNTQVQIDGQSYTLNKGGFFTSAELTEASFITADKNVSVAQYSLTQACSSVNGDELIGDPEMVLLNPVEFNVKSTTLFSSDQQNIDHRYINVLMKTSATSTFKVNGQVLSATWNPVPSNPGYSYTQIEITDISSYLTANEGFNAVAYGFGDHESYAYSAGTNLAANTYFLVTNKITQRDARNACLGQESDFKVILPYLVSKITWKLDDGAEEEGPLNPKVITASDGSLSYAYSYDKNITFSALGQHQVVIKIELPNDGSGCLSEGAEFIYPFDVFPLPTADFNVAADNCPDTEIQFTDLSTSNLPDHRPLNKWLWDFGDNTTSTAQNPKHVYASSGPFEVKLSVGLDEGCMSDVKTFTIHIRPKINAALSAPANGCINKEIAFADASSSAAGPMVSWQWDFGDGSAVSIQQHPKHTYLSAGTYTVTLITRTANGCQSLPAKSEVVIHSLPVVDFTLPRVCVNDVAQFTNKSANVDATTAGLIYSWDFGDGTALAADNVSTQVNGSHQYRTGGIYTVTLTATNANGCSFSVSKQFTVNGGHIRPAFEVENKNALCSNRKITVQNKSTINSGKIIRLVWYIDNAEKLTVNDPDPDAFYELSPPVAISPAAQTIAIKLLAYSGDNCVEPLTENVTLYPAPALVFDPIAPVCLNSAIFRIQSARETLGIPPQNSSYSGPGIISADGYFDPRQAGVGTHTLTYHYSSAAGCEESVTQVVTVQPLPELDLKRDIYLLSGGEIRIDARASGNNLRYKWVPATGLDRDDVLNPVVKIDEDREYTLTVTTGLGCSITGSVKVHLVSSINAANAFSPNGDGVNDTWVLKYIETYPNVAVDVFNRYGEKVFSSQGYSVPFDGNYNGKQLPVGTYYYIINPKNGKKLIKGALTLVR